MKDTRTRTLGETRKARARIVAEETHRLQGVGGPSECQNIRNQGCNDNVHGQAELLCLLEDLDSILEAERRDQDDGIQVIETLVKEADGWSLFMRLWHRRMESCFPFVAMHLCRF